MGFLIAAAAFKVAGLFHSNSARRARKRARRARQAITAIQNAQARRAFLQKFRGAQAAVLAGFGAREGGLESSAARGQLASQITQARFGIFEQELQQKFAAIEAAAINKAEKKQFRAGIANAFSSFALSAGSVAEADVPSNGAQVDGGALPGFDPTAEGT